MLGNWIEPEAWLVLENHDWSTFVSSTEEIVMGKGRLTCLAIPLDHPPVGKTDLRELKDSVYSFEKYYVRCNMQ